jgi:chromosome partitioning protein
MPESFVEERHELAALESCADRSQAKRAALVVADTVVIPVQPRTFDVWSTVAVLNMADPSGSDNGEALEAISGIEGIECLEVTIGR